jgi:hypothetical protein
MSLIGLILVDMLVACDYTNVTGLVERTQGCYQTVSL